MNKLKIHKNTSTTPLTWKQQIVYRSKMMIIEQNVKNFLSFINFWKFKNKTFSIDFFVKIYPIGTMGTKWNE